jgi:hypothetical protein
MKTPDHKLKYGPEVEAMAVADELQKAMGIDDSPGLIRKEEFVGRESTRLIRGRPVVDVLATTEVTVVERAETSLQWQIKDVERIQNYDPYDPTNTPAPIVREDHKCWNKQTIEREECDIVSMHTSPPRKSQTAEAHLRPFSHFQSKATGSDKSVSYHNLIVQHLTLPPPDDVVKDSQCRGLPQCQIAVTQIEFDRVDWTQEEEGYKIHYLLKISRDVPALSRFLESCQQGSVKVVQPGVDPEKAPRFLVTFCETVKNFIPGLPNSTKE